jgi:hypothetical protein
MAQLRPEFTPITVTPEGQAGIDEARMIYSQLADQLDKLVPENSRAKSIAKTHLEESAHWVIRAIAEAHRSQ